MSIEAQKCNKPSCKGYIVFENADFDLNNIQTNDKGFYEFDNTTCTECGEKYYIVPHYIAISLDENGDYDYEAVPTSITNYENRLKELKGR